MTDYTAPHVLNALVGMEEVVSRALAAAKDVLKGEDHTRRLDCAADIVARVMELAPRDGCRRCGAPRAYRVTLDSGVPGVTATVPMCTAHAAGHLDRRPVLADERDSVARRHLSFYRLKGMAKNWLASEVARADREMKVAADATTITMESYPSTHRDPTGNRYRAADAAAEILDTLGVDPTGDALFNVAYAAVRESAGLSAEEIATELAVKPGTLRQHVNRAAGKVPSAAVYSPRVHAEALHVDEYWTAPRSKDATALPSNFDASNRTTDEAGGWKDRARLKADARIERTGTGGRRVVGKSQWTGARSNGGTRINPGDRTPNVKGGEVPASPVTVRTVAPTAAPWEGDTCAAWAESMYPSTAARMAAAAREQRTRANALTDLERDAIRASAGIPAGS